MPEVPDSLARKEKDSKDSPELIQWYTVTYKSVALWLIVLSALVFGGLLAAFPQWRAEVSDYITGAGRTVAPAPSAVQQIRFTNLEGQVRVRKANQVQWTPADISIELNEGDTVQTLHNSMARIAFANNALYVVKQDTLIVIESGSGPNEKKASNVAVNVTSGVVDLSTARGSGDSRVRVANAEARIHQESRALLSNDPQTNSHQITVSQGGASVTRGGQKVELAQYDQVTFAGPESPIVKQKIVGAPILLTPANNAPLVLFGAPTTEIEFTWNAVAGASSYRLRISSSPNLSTPPYDRRMASTSVRVPSFKEGNYYWTVSSFDAAQKESVQSEPNQFSVIKQEGQGELLLQVDKYIQMGKAIEIIGRTEPGATVLVNTEPVFNMAPDGTFRHLTAPLPNTGTNLITITAQNNKGKVATLRKTITIQ